VRTGGRHAAPGPLIARIRTSVLATDRLHADDTPIRVLDPSRRAGGAERGVTEGRIRVYVRDDRPWALGGLTDAELMAVITGTRAVE